MNRRRRSSNKSTMDKAKKIDFRLADEYAPEVAETATASRLEPNDFARVSTILTARHKFLDVNERLKNLEQTTALLPSIEALLIQILNRTPGARER